MLASKPAKFEIDHLDLIHPSKAHKRLARKSLRGTPTPQNPPDTPKNPLLGNPQRFNSVEFALKTNPPPTAPRPTPQAVGHRQPRQNRDRAGRLLRLDSASLDGRGGDRGARR